jgi:hypothetical protein
MHPMMDTVGVTHQSTLIVNSFLITMNVGNHDLGGHNIPAKLGHGSTCPHDITTVVKGVSWRQGR